MPDSDSVRDSNVPCFNPWFLISTRDGENKMGRWRIQPIVALWLGWLQKAASGVASGLPEENFARGGGRLKM
jgi:hypothetical protein